MKLGLHPSITPLSGGLVNSTFRIDLTRTRGTTRVILQRSQRIPDKELPFVLMDARSCQEIGIRQIQIEPSKFIKARAISTFLQAHSFPHARVLGAQTYKNYGIMLLEYIEGTPGDNFSTLGHHSIWAQIGEFLGTINQLPIHNLVPLLNIKSERMHAKEWLYDRFCFLLSRLTGNGIDIDTVTALKGCRYLLSVLPDITSPICLNYDDPKPASLILPSKPMERPVVIDLESFTIGHRVIDGVGRGLYWGPVGIPLGEKREPLKGATEKVLQGYNNVVPSDWRVHPEDVHLWCVASELFWLADVIGIHTLAPILPASKVQNIERRIGNLSSILSALRDKNLNLAKIITFS